MGESLYFYKLVSPYENDTTLNCKLTVNQIDSNFLTLKDFDIAKAEFDRESKTLVLTRNNGEKLIADLSDVTYDLNVNTESSESGVTLTISYDGKESEKNVTIENIVTADNLMSIIGSDVLTKVITDGTLKGNGTLWSPLGLNGVEKTGTLAPAIAKIDLTTGGHLPLVSKLGTRYVTVEYVDDYGYLYNGAGLLKIKHRLDKEGKGWRIPTKADWDALLNSIEPCNFKNHDSNRCHVELGLLAGKFLKSECGWIGQEECTCNGTAPTSCTTQYDLSNDDYSDCTYLEGDEPSYKRFSPKGVDKYGMTIRPCGSGEIDNLGRITYDGFKNKSVLWTTTHVYDDVEQDLYVKVFDYNRGGVFQEADCPLPYYSVRLVKDYDGGNYFDTEYIDGKPYKTLLFPETKQVWLATNFASKEGFIGSDYVPTPSSCTTYDESLYDLNDNTQHDSTTCCPKRPIIEYLKVNGGEEISRRKAIFINEWNGKYWDKKMMLEGDTIVIQNPCLDDSEDGITRNICWKDSSGETHCVEVVIPSVEQSNLEYRVYSTDECDKVLVNTDDIAVERILTILIPLLEEERVERIAADEALNEKIDAEIERATSAETALDEKIDAETERAISAETALDEKIDAEIERAISAETALNEKIEAEIERAISAETALDEKIDAEIERAISAETALNEKIEAETQRALEEEERIEGKLDDEIERSIGEDIRLEAKIDAEIERATSEESRIEGLIIKPNENGYRFGVSVDGTYLETRDGDQAHYIKLIFDGNFGEI